MCHIQKKYHHHNTVNVVVKRERCVKFFKKVSGTGGTFQEGTPVSGNPQLADDDRVIRMRERRGDIFVCRPVILPVFSVKKIAELIFLPCGERNLY